MNKRQAKKITVRQLRSMVSEAVRAIEESDLQEITMSQAKVEGPLRDLMASLNDAKKSLGPSGAKRALADLYQHADSPQAKKDAELLLDALGKTEAYIDNIVKWLNKRQDLTQDPWTHVRKRG